MFCMSFVWQGYHDGYLISSSTHYAHKLKNRGNMAPVTSLAQGHNKRTCCHQLQDLAHHFFAISYTGAFSVCYFLDLCFDLLSVGA